MQTNELSAYALSGLGLLLLLVTGLAALRARRAHALAVAAMQEQRLRAATDDLTGLANRREFMAALTREFARASREHVPLSLAIIDIDHFKRVNDSFGHPAGDRVIRDIARLAAAGMRAGDLVGRLGGEEFGILMPLTAAGAATAACERLRCNIHDRQVPLPSGRMVSVTLSSGVAEHVPGESIDALIARADAALYEAKQQGRDQVRLAA